MLPTALGATLLAALAAAAAVSRRRRNRLARGADAFLGRFERLPELGTYRQGLPLVHLPGPKRPHAVLLLHGFSGSPASFQGLTGELEARGIPYYAPPLLGHGLDGLRILTAARGTDWRREVYQAYQLLAAIADEVSVVAISFGTLLAADLAREHPVRHMVWLSPYFHLRTDMDRRMAAHVRNPAKRAAALALSPLIAKPVRANRTLPVDICDPVASAKHFQFPAIPLAALMEIWAYPRVTDFQALRMGTLDVLWGEEDQTADTPSCLAALDVAGVAYTAHPFSASGHNLLDDYDGRAAALAIAERLAGR
jgi:pimeloyl-ACP methyl ester carboxylesterase